MLLKEVVFPSGKDPQYLLEYVIGFIIPGYEAALWRTQNAEKIHEAVALIKEKRLLKAMQIGGINRAHDELSWSYLRILAEYRAHHDWRNHNQFVNAKILK